MSHIGTVGNCKSISHRVEINRAPNVFDGGFRPRDLDDNLCMSQKINRVALMAEQLRVATLNA